MTVSKSVEVVHTIGGISESFTGASVKRFPSGNYYELTLNSTSARPSAQRYLSQQDLENLHALLATALVDATK